MACLAGRSVPFWRGVAPLPLPHTLPSVMSEVLAAMEASPSCVVVDIVADGNSQSNKLAAGAMPVAPRRLDGVPDNSKSNKSPGLVPHETKKRWLSPLVPDNALSNKKPDAVPYEPDYNPLSNKMPTAEPFFGRDNSHSNKLPTGAVPFHYVRASPSTCRASCSSRRGGCSG